MQDKVGLFAEIISDIPIGCSSSKDALAMLNRHVKERARNDILKQNEYTTWDMISIIYDWDSCEFVYYTVIIILLNI